MKIQNPEVFRLHAEFCKVLANRKRLMILALLSKHELSVGEIVKSLEMRLTNISQHLRVLRSHNIVKRRKEGQTVYYSLADPRLIEACTLIRSVLLDDLKKRGMIAQEIDVDSLVIED